VCDLCERLYFKYLCRFNELKKGRTEEKVNEKRGAGSANTEQKKRQKEMYVVNKNKWYLSATKEELQTLPSMVLDGVDMEDKNRIIQYSVR